MGDGVNSVGGNAVLRLVGVGLIVEVQVIHIDGRVLGVKLEAYRMIRDILWSICPL